MTEHLKEIFKLLEVLDTDERNLILAECVRKFGVEFGEWEIHMKEQNTVLLIDSRENKHGFIFTKDGEFKII